MMNVTGPRLLSNKGSDRSVTRHIIDLEEQRLNAANALASLQHRALSPSQAIRTQMPPDSLAHADDNHERRKGTVPTPKISNQVDDSKDAHPKWHDVRNTSCKSITFPQKLREILTQQDEDGDAAIKWLPSGAGFIILKPKKFTLEVLPRFFKQTEFSSFTRKLYWWGFKKTSRGQNCDSFHHELFTRDKPELCLKMRGRTIETRCSKGVTKKGGKSSPPIPVAQNLTNKDEHSPSSYGPAVSGLRRDPVPSALRRDHVLTLLGKNAIPIHHPGLEAGTIQNVLSQTNRGNLAVRPVPVNTPVTSLPGDVPSLLMGRAPSNFAPVVFAERHRSTGTAPVVPPTVAFFLERQRQQQMVQAARQRASNLMKGRNSVNCLLAQPVVTPTKATKAAAAHLGKFLHPPATTILNHAAQARAQLPALLVPEPQAQQRPVIIVHHHHAGSGTYPSTPSHLRVHITEQHLF